MLGRERHGPVPVPLSQRSRRASPVTPPADARTAACQRGRHEAAGEQGAAEFLDRDGELGQPEALAAVRLGQVQAEQALLGQARPERVAVKGGTAVVAVGGRPDR